MLSILEEESLYHIPRTLCFAIASHFCIGYSRQTYTANRREKVPKGAVSGGKSIKVY
jgi:hypothetical protein